VPGDEPGFVVASGKLDERGSQLFDSVEGPHPTAGSPSRSHGEVDSDRHFGRVRLLPPTLEATSLDANSLESIMGGALPIAGFAAFSTMVLLWWKRPPDASPLLEQS
jgi:hypothetical protein